MQQAVRLQHQEHFVKHQPLSILKLQIYLPVPEKIRCISTHIKNQNTRDANQ